MDLAVRLSRETRSVKGQYLEAVVVSTDTVAMALNFVGFLTSTTQ